jgi:hypothetical protein
MQHHFAGDIGDYLKLGILRALAPGYRLGVAWWLYPDEVYDGNGQHVGYIQRPGQWRHFDPALFDTLQRILSSGQRNVHALATGLPPDTIFHHQPIPTTGRNLRGIRQEWFRSVVATVKNTDLVFVDPDNGLEPGGISLGSARAGKSVLLSELHELAKPDRCLIVYHHQTRRAGGHYAEIAHWLDRFRSEGFRAADALRCKPYSPRVFFLLNAPEKLRQRAARIEADWHRLITWHAGEPSRS